jgi:hypothetical protein
LPGDRLAEAHVDEAALLRGTELVGVLDDLSPNRDVFRFGPAEPFGDDDPQLIAYVTDGMQERGIEFVEGCLHGD